MKIKSLVLASMLIAPAFADSYSGILNDTDYQDLMTAIAMDEFSSAVLENPSIAYNAQGQTKVFGTSNPASSQMEFRYADGYKLNNIDLVKINSFQQESPTLEAQNEEGMWTGVSTLSSPYDESPNGINITQNSAVR